MKSTLKAFVLATIFAASVASAKTAPAFRGETMDGKKASLETALKPDRLLLLSFWATWCLPCMEELTHVKEKLEKEPTLPLDVLTVNIDRENQSEVASTLRQIGVKFPVILDPNAQILTKYHKAGTLPYSVLIGPNKEIKAEFNGFHPSMFEKISAAAATLTKK